jgi:hypothetical protein
MHMNTHTEADSSFALSLAEQVQLITGDSLALALARIAGFASVVLTDEQIERLLTILRDSTDNA